MTQSRFLYEAWLELMSQLRKVSRGNGKEKALGEAIQDLVVSQFVPADVVAAVVESAAASAEYAARQCKECAGHAKDAANKTLLDFDDGPDPAKKAKAKTSKAKPKSKAPAGAQA